MKPDLWMPLYIADYLADTSRLSTEQHGAYLLLLMDYWRSGPPPDNDTILAQITKLPHDAWSIARSILHPLFQVRDGFWFHKRVEKELAKARNLQVIAHERGKKGAEARWGGSNNAPSNALSNASSIDGALPKQSSKQCLGDAPSPSPSPSPLTSTTHNQSLPNGDQINTTTGEVTTTKKRQQRPPFVPPVVADVVAEGERILLPREECEAFLAHHEARGWVSGRTKIVSWKHALITWNKNFRAGTFKGNGATNGHANPKSGTHRGVSYDADKSLTL